MIASIATIVAPVFLVVTIGYLYGIRFRPSMESTNEVNLAVFIPALIFSTLATDEFDLANHTDLAMGGALVIFGSGLLAYIFSRLVKQPWRENVPPAMFSNWANLGLPLYVFSFGPEAIYGGVVLFVLGNLITFSLGIYIFSGKLSLVSVIKTPVIIAVVLGLLVNMTELTLPEWLMNTTKMLGQVAIPLMLFSLGVRLCAVNLQDARDGLVMAIFCPVVGVALALLATVFIELTPLQTNILLLFGVLPPAVMNFILAEQYQGEKSRARVAAMVMVGNLFALFSVPILLFFLLPA